jgi:hypothetical protein
MAVAAGEEVEDVVVIVVCGWWSPAFGGVSLFFNGLCFKLLS